MRYKAGLSLIAKEAVYRMYNNSFIIGNEYIIREVDEHSQEYNVTTEHGNTLFFFTDKNIDALFYIGKRENELWI